MEGAKTETERLEGALRYAIAVIESYRLDIRNSREIGESFKKLPLLSDMGFCQGTFYEEAFSTIERIRNGDIPSPFGSRTDSGDKRIVADNHGGLNDNARGD